MHLCVCVIFGYSSFTWIGDTSRAAIRCFAVKLLLVTLWKWKKYRFNNDDSLVLKWSSRRTKTFILRCEFVDCIDLSYTHSFSVRTPDDVKFSQKLLIDTMYFNNRPMSHVINRGTRFSSAKYLQKAHPKTLRNTLMQAWSFLYVWHPESILTDRGSAMRNEE